MNDILTRLASISFHGDFPQSARIIVAGMLMWAIGSQRAIAVDATWERIRYPRLPVPEAADETFEVMVTNNRLNKETSWQFNVIWRGSRQAKRPDIFTDASRITVRWHGWGRAVTEPAPGWQHWVGVGNGLGMSWSMACNFPWGRNALDESWVELRLPGQTYWMELPYGFTRPPTAPEVTEPARAGPVFLPTVKVGPQDRLVPWRHVEYDLGIIQNGWRLFLNMANPFDTRSEVTLYRDDVVAGKSMFRWELHEPPTAMTIERDGAQPLVGRKMSVRLHEDGMRRSDEFYFNRNGSPEARRGWGRVIIQVDNRRSECVIPSSLFNYVHGVTDPSHPQLFQPHRRE